MTNPNWARGGSGEGRYRKQVGVTNVCHRDIKQAFRLLIEKNLDNMTVWLAQIAEHNPVKAMEFMLELSERFLPKVNRTELTGAEGKTLELPPVIVYGKHDLLAKYLQDANENKAYNSGGMLEGPQTAEDGLGRPALEGECVESTDTRTEVAIASTSSVA